MLRIDEFIHLNTYNKTEKLLIEFKYLVQEHFTFEVSIVSNKFSGASHFCASKNDIKSFTDDLTCIYSKLEGSAKLTDFDSDAFIEFSVHPLGQLTIRGQIGGSHEDQFLKFRFESDQTILQPFRSDLSKLCHHQDRNEP